MFSDKFFEWYKNAKVIIKILLFGVALLFGALWVVGSLAHWDRCIMFIIGALIASILIYIFYPQINEFITNIINNFI